MPMKKWNIEKNETSYSAPFVAVTGLSDAPIDLRSIMDELAAGIALIDLQNRILFMNNSLEVLTGFLEDDGWIHW